MTEPNQFVPIAKPWMGPGETEAVRRPLTSGWVTQGPEVAAFEREFAAYVGAPHACAVSTCTAALHLALEVVGVRAGDEVITVSHSFIATANSIRYCGATPVFVDIRPGTFNIDPDRIEAAVTERTRCILCVHQMGMPCDLGAVLDVARRHSLSVVEDAACAVGSEVRRRDRWERIGKPHGDVACFSFHPRKIITTGDGGMVTCSREDWDRQLRLLRQHGMSVPDTVRHGASKVIFESYVTVGYNYRMTDIQAAVGRAQMERLPEIIGRRRTLAERYQTELARVPGLILPHEPPWARSNWQSFCVRLPARCSQRRVMQFLLDKGVASRRGIMCAHREPAYQDGSWVPGTDRCSDGISEQEGEPLKESELAQDHCIVLPLYPEMTESDQRRVVETLSEACRIDPA